jgi:NTP pyrophosphatase (non-canonical NTP hydrolase)
MERGKNYMNKIEHLLTCLAEECAEVQQAVAKALRFGLDDGYPCKTTTNAEDIAYEYKDLVAVMEMLELEIEGISKLANSEVDKRIKKEKVIHYMEYAKKRGTLI